MGGNSGKGAYKAVCRNGSEESSSRYNSIENNVRKMVSNAMRENLRKDLISGETDCLSDRLF